MSPNANNGFHIHEFGDLTGVTVTANVGGHWNPLNSNHAYPPSSSRHFGDMGNITTNDGGLATFTNTFDLLTLNGNHSIVGRAVVIHEKADDYTTQPTGAAGDRIACGVIGAGKL